MAEFILVDSEYSDIPSILKEMVPEFYSSPEASSLTPSDDKLPGVVCARLADYLVRLHETFNEGRRTTRIKTEINRCYSAIERLASSRDPLVQNVVVTEIFEVLNCGVIVRKQVKSRLGPKSRALYDQYIREGERR